MKEVLNRMEIELKELKLKIDKLEEFIQGAKFKSLSSDDCEWLVAQLGAMKSYHFILKTRYIRMRSNSANQAVMYHFD